MLVQITKNQLPFGFLRKDYDYYFRSLSFDQVLTSKNFLIFSFDTLSPLSSPYVFLTFDVGKVRILKSFLKYSSVDCQNIFGQALFSRLRMLMNEDFDLEFNIRVDSINVGIEYLPFYSQFPISNISRLLTYIVFDKTQYESGLSTFLYRLNRLCLPVKYSMTFYPPGSAIKSLLISQGFPRQLYDENIFDYPNLSLDFLHNETGNNTWTSLLTLGETELVAWLSVIISDGFMNLRGSSVSDNFPTKIYWIMITKFLLFLFDKFPDHKISFALQPGNRNFIDVVLNKIAFNYPGVCVTDHFLECKDIKHIPSELS